MAHGDRTKGMAIGMMQCNRSVYRVRKELNINRQDFGVAACKTRRTSIENKRRGSRRPRWTGNAAESPVVVHRMLGERFASCCDLEHDCHGDGSVMLWAGILHGGRTAAMVIQATPNTVRYKNDIMLLIVAPTVSENHLVFKDNNATHQRAGTVRSVVRDSGIPTLPPCAITGSLTYRACVGRTATESALQLCSCFFKSGRAVSAIARTVDVDR